MDKRGKYNEVLYDSLLERNKDFDSAFMTALEQPSVKKSLQHRSRMNDWEYIQARKSVEVDTKNYVAPPQKPSHHIGEFYHSIDLNSDRELDR